MSDIKKTALIILIIMLLSNTFTQYAYAANNYDHDELMQYEGYGKAMFESVVEQTTFVTGQYTDNQQYVSDSIDLVKDYANFWSNERQILENACGGLSLFSNDCLGTAIEKGGAYFLTVGDWLKNLFSDYDVNLNGQQGLHDLSSYFTFQSNSMGGGWLTVREGYVFNTEYNGFYDNDYRSAATLSINFGGNNRDGYYLLRSLHFDGRSYELPTLRGDYEQAYAYYSETLLSSSSDMLNYLESTGVHFRVYDASRLPVNPSGYEPPDRNITMISNYINNNPVQIPVPQLKPQLVCPNGTKILMNINGSTFLAVDGTVMMVEKDGTAEVSGQICNLNWQKPTVEYDPNGEPIVTNPDGTKTNLNTGDTTNKPPGATDLEGCTGVLCGIGKLLDGVGSVVTAIGDLVKKLLDGLIGLFVPDDLDFLTEEFNKITKKLNDKIAITETLKEAITSVFDGGGSNPLANISINLPITNEPLTFGNVSFIEEGVPILRRVISAIVVLYTIAYVYRKITGRGGVMER